MSVVVPSRDRPDLLVACLEALGRVMAADDEVIVVDSASRAPTDGELAAMAARHRARSVRCERPGASLARNAGVAAASHEVVAFLDDDVRVLPGWADGIGQAFARHPGAAFVTGWIGVAPDQSGYARPVAVTERTEAVAITAQTSGVLGHSANLAVRREVFQAIGGFDELLGAGARFPAAEDVDLFDRLLAAGHTGWFEPAAPAWHDQWRTRRELVALEWSYGVGNGARLSKLLRTDRRRARAMAVQDLWDTGVRTIPGLVRERYEFGIAYALARTTGTFIGMARGAAVPVRGGRFSPRRSR